MTNLRFLLATVVACMIVAGPAVLAQQSPAPNDSVVDEDGRVWIYRADRGCSLTSSLGGEVLQLDVGQKNHAITLSSSKQIGVQKGAAYTVALIVGTQTWQKQASGVVMTPNGLRFEGYQMYADLPFIKALPRSGIIKYGVFDLTSNTLLTQSVDTSHEFYQRWLRCVDATK